VVGDAGALHQPLPQRPDIEAVRAPVRMARKAVVDVERLVLAGWFCSVW